MEIEFHVLNTDLISSIKTHTHTHTHKHSLNLKVSFHHLIIIKENIISLINIAH